MKPNSLPEHVDCPHCSNASISNLSIMCCDGSRVDAMCLVIGITCALFFSLFHFPPHPSLSAADAWCTLTAYFFTICSTGLRIIPVNCIRWITCHVFCHVFLRVLTVSTRLIATDRNSIRRNVTPAAFVIFLTGVRGRRHRSSWRKTKPSLSETVLRLRKNYRALLR